VSVGLSLVPHFSHAAEAVLSEAGARVQITTGDVQGDALRIPPDVRAQALAKPEAVLQLANNLAIRRALAAQAEKEGLANDPAMQGAIRVARDKTLSDALLAKLDAQNKPEPAVVEALARTNYNANPARFNLPEQLEVSHILLKKEDPAARTKAEFLQTQLRGGAPFAALAREHSQDVASSGQGGFLGPLARGQTVPEFEEAYMKLAEGQVSPVIETRFGYHIIKMDRRLPAGVRTFDQIKQGLLKETEDKILMDKRMEYIQKIQDTIKHDKAAIEAFTKATK